MILTIDPNFLGDPSRENGGKTPWDGAPSIINPVYTSVFTGYISRDHEISHVVLRDETMHVYGYEVFPLIFGGH